LVVGDRFCPALGQGRSGVGMGFFAHAASLRCLESRRQDGLCANAI
jgi:hypothetical protein